MQNAKAWQYQIPQVVADDHHASVEHVDDADQLATELLVALMARHLGRDVAGSSCRLMVGLVRLLPCFGIRSVSAFQCPHR
jgi:hypothetical protein